MIKIEKMNVRLKNIQEKCFSFVRKSERYILVSEDINFLTFDIIFIKKRQKKQKQKQIFYKIK